MVWLYLPESEDLSSGLTSLYPHQELFVMSRGKPMPLLSLSRKWNKGGFIRLLSGLMLPPSMAKSGVERWISLVPDSHASLGVLQVNKKGRMTNDGFGMTSSELLAKLDLDSSFWKTSQVSLMGDLIPFLGPWPKSGSMLNGELSKRRMLAQTTIGPDFSYSPIVPKEGYNFPTPTVMDSSLNGDTMRKVAKESLQKGKWRGINLVNCVKMFPTPTLGESKNVGYQISNGKKYPTLTGTMMMFPTPTALEAQKAGIKSFNKTGQSLTSLVKMGMFNTPTASDGQNSTLPPSHANWGSLPGDMIRSGHARNGGVLNPQWVEWLMGWPIGWTDLEPVAMESFPCRQQPLIQSSSKEPSKEVV